MTGPADHDPFDPANVALTLAAAGFPPPVTVRRILVPSAVAAERADGVSLARQAALDARQRGGS